MSWLILHFAKLFGPKEFSMKRVASLFIILSLAIFLGCSADSQKKAADNQRESANSQKEAASYQREAANNRREAYDAGNAFLMNLTKGNLEKAFDYVAYFDQASDIAPTIAYKDAKQKWIERVGKLKESGTFIKSFSNLTISLNDSCPIGDITIHLSQGGQEKTMKAYIEFSNLHKEWKVLGIHAFSMANGDSDFSAFERAIGGSFKNPDSEN